MPPHCDSMDGPVVTAARRALEAGDVDLVLPFVHEPGEDEVRVAFGRSMAARELAPAAQEVADLYFFETVVRVHRAGEGAPYTGLKRAGLGEGPVIPLAEKAIDTRSVQDLRDFLAQELDAQLKRRLDLVVVGTPRDGAPVPEMRRYVEAMLGFEVYSHHLYLAMQDTGHAG